MDYCAVQPTDEDRKLCYEIICETLKYEKLDLSKKELELLTDDILETVSSMGGDFSKKNLRAILLEYIRSDFLERFRYIHRNER